MSAQVRLEKVKNCKLCFNCLKPFHGKGCNYGSCKKCHKRHNTLLHMDKADLNVPAPKVVITKVIINDSSAPSVDREDKVESNKKSAHNATNSLSSNCLYDLSLYVLLSTATINIRDYFGNLHVCRALLDSGSQPNFMSREL